LGDAERTGMPMEPRYGLRAAQPSTALSRCVNLGSLLDITDCIGSYFNRRCPPLRTLSEISPNRHVRLVHQRSEVSFSTFSKPHAHPKPQIRCGVPDCDWGSPLSSFSESQWSRCRRQFRKHCIERHGLDPNDHERLCWSDLEALTLTLLGHPS
jgi:hypothetical protein